MNKGLDRETRRWTLQSASTIEFRKGFSALHVSLRLDTEEEKRKPRRTFRSSDSSAPQLEATLANASARFALQSAQSASRAACQAKPSYLLPASTTRSCRAAFPARRASSAAQPASLGTSVLSLTSRSQHRIRLYPPLVCAMMATLTLQGVSQLGG